MSSSQKTDYLQLNAWLGTDRPQRIDFVDDNTIIDKVIKNHIENTTMHCSGEEKTRLNNPYIVKSYAGTGESTKTIEFDFVPQLVIVFKRESLPVVTEADGTATVNCGIAVKSMGSTGGVSISDKTVTVTYNATATDGVKYNLNYFNDQYVVVAFK